jgi:galactoside O-acetyltransferase
MGYGLKYEGVGTTIHEPVILLKPHVIALGDFSRVDGFCKLEGGEGITLGKWVHCASYAHLNIGGGRLVAGDGVSFASGCRVISGGNTPDGLTMSAAAPIYRQVIERKTTRFEDNSCVLTGAVILGGVTLHEGAVAAAGSVVTHDIPAWEIWAGNPARKIAERKRPQIAVPPAQVVNGPFVKPMTQAEYGAALLAGMDEFEAVHRADHL